MIEQQLAPLLERKFVEPAFSDCFLLEIKVHPNNRVEVFLDSDQGITFDKCQKISRYLEGYIDEAGWLGERYTLEVSSPGATRPLELPRQYPKHVGRKLAVETTEGDTWKGKLTEVTGEGISLEVKRTWKEGKKKRKAIEQMSIPFDNITKAIVQLSF